MADVPTHVRFDQALAIIREVAARHRLDSESLALPRTHGRVLAQDVAARRPLSPAAADAVVNQGDARRHGQVLTVPGDTPPDAHVRRTGEDAGDQVMRAGEVLTPTRVSTAASWGLAALLVARKPTVAVFTGGDHLIEPGLPLERGQTYDSQRELLMGLLRADGLEPTAWPRLPDDPKQIEVAMRDAGCAFDLIITCGTVSAGDQDPIAAVLAQFGQLHFRAVQMTPGSSLSFGSLDQARILSLPGGSVSVLTAYLALGRALIDGLQGRTEARPVWYAQLTRPIDTSHSCREFVRGRLRSDEVTGRLLVDPDSASGLQRSRFAAEPDVLIVVPDGTPRLPVGAVVEVLRYP